MKKVLVAASLLLTIVINALANILPFNGVTTAEVSNSIETYFVPAPYVFSIWSVIYLGLIAYVVSLFIKKSNNKNDDLIAPWFIISNIANAGWMLAWHYGLHWLTVILMLIILASLIKISLILKDEKEFIKTAPFSIYLGWISVATIANIAATLTVYNWDGFGISGQMWSTIMIAIATVLTTLRLRFHKDILYSLVIVWALIGIMYKFLTISDLMIGAILVSLLVIFTNIVLSQIKIER